jgi:ATP-dependent Clp protease ATP-binding subunit ClpC
MPKINVYLPDDLAAAVRDAQVPVSAVCQAALEQAVRNVTSAHAADEPPNDDQGRGLFKRFTPRAREAMEQARLFAVDFRHGHVGTEHVLLGIIETGGNLAIRVLEALDVEIDDLRDELEASMGPAKKAKVDRAPFTPEAKSALKEATKEALMFGHNYIGCEHLLLGLLATEEGLASKVLRRMGLELRTTRRTVGTVLAGVVHEKTTSSKKAASSSERAASTIDSTLTEILTRLDTIEQRLA